MLKCAPFVENGFGIRIPRFPKKLNGGIAMDLITTVGLCIRFELDRDLPETLSYLKEPLWLPLPCRVFSPAESALCAFFDFGRDHSLAFRADMDALAVPEATGLPFASRHPGGCTPAATTATWPSS